MGTPQRSQPSAGVSHSSQTWCSRLELGWQVQLNCPQLFILYVLKRLSSFKNAEQTVAQ